jgi:hypothetical protein
MPSKSWSSSPASAAPFKKPSNLPFAC